MHNKVSDWGKRSCLLAAACLLLACSKTHPRVPEEGSLLGYEVKPGSSKPGLEDSETLEQSSRSLHEFLMGELAYQEEEFDEALRHFERAKNFAGDAAGAAVVHARLADLYVRSARLEDALREVRQARTEDEEKLSYAVLEAGILESLGRSQEALDVLRETVRRHPDDVRPKLLMANLLVRMKEYQAVIVLLQPELKKGHEQRAILATMIAGSLEAQGKGKQAKTFLLAEYEATNKNVDVGHQAIRLLAQEGDVAALRSFCERMQKDHPQDPLARRVLSELALSEKNAASAVKQLEALEGLSQDTEDSRYRLALVYAEQREWALAEQELHLVLAKNMQHVRARYILASVLSATGRNSEALAELQRIPSDSEMGDKARLLEGFIYRQINKPQEALQSLRKAHELQPDNTKTISYLILALREENKLGEASKVLAQAIQRKPHSASLRYQHAMLLSELGEIEEAEESAREAIRLDPKHADALNFLAYSIAERSEDADELAEAMSLIERALVKRPGDGYFLDTKGWILFQQKKFAEAVQVLELAVAASQEDPVILEHYGDALRTFHRASEARKAYERAIDRLRGNKRISEEEKKLLQRVGEKLEDLRKTYPEQFGGKRVP